MTRFEKSPSGETFRLLITPNVALSARQSRLVISGLVSYGIAVALAATALGAWPVLPFFGFELMVLAIGWSIVRRRSRDYEELCVTERHVDIRLHRGHHDRSCRFLRYWTRVDLQAAHWRGHPSRLHIGSHGRCVEIGHDLTEEDRIELAQRLDCLLATT